MARYRVAFQTVAGWNMIDFYSYEEALRNYNSAKKTAMFSQPELLKESPPGPNGEWTGWEHIK